MELGESQPADQALIRGDAVPVLSDCRIMANKVIIKGILMLNCLYVSDITNGDTQKTRYEIPFSQIVDVDGLDEEYQCEIGMDVTGSEIHISSNQSGEGRLLEVSFKLTASVQCHRTDMVEIVTDAFSSSCPVECQSRRLDTRHLIAVRHDSPVIHETFDMPSENIADILDVWCEAVPLSERCEDGVSVIDGRLMIYMLARMRRELFLFMTAADFK